MAPKNPSAPPKIATPYWVIDLSAPSSSRNRIQNATDPPGYSVGGSSKKSQKAVVTPTQSETDDLKIKKAWEIALAPAKSLPMNAFMMYMSGNSLQIFSIMMTVMLFMNPIRAISNVGNTFARFDGETTHSRLLIVKVAFIGLQIGTILLGIWKVNGMGLLPTTRSDWLAWEREPNHLEYSAPKFG